MNGLTASTVADDTSADFDLDITIVELGAVAGETGSDPCTADTCGSTRQSACTTC